MSEHVHGSAVAHHFHDARQQREAGTLGMWTFLLTEVMFFGGLFTSYALYRWHSPEGFAHASSHLDVTLGALNTGVLILSSFTMALAVHAAQTSKRNLLLLFLILTILLGLTFLGIKGVEYSHKFHEHLVPGAHFDYPEPHREPAYIFFSLYFAMTGLHALHMIGGIGLMLVLLYMGWRGRFSSNYFSPVELGGLYWHFVDIVWIFLFPLLYLVGRH